MKTKTIWVVDSGYMFKGCPGDFDYLKLKSRLEEYNGSAFSQSFYLSGQTDGFNKSQASFYRWLKSAPPIGPKMRVKLYPLKTVDITCHQCGREFAKTVQKGVDVAIATLIIKLAVQDQYTRLVLSAGDGDLEDAIAFVKEDLQKEVWLAGFQESMSPDLQSYADRAIWLEQFWGDLEKDKTKSIPGLVYGT